MNISQIKYVLEVANSSSIREPATRLYISQPALSASIKELEDELGILIFERTNKGIYLTDEGREFVSYAKKVASQYEIMEERYLSKDADKERFSVSTQHFSFSIHETKTKDVLEDVKNLKSEVGIISFSSTNEAVIKKLIKEYALEFTPLMKRDAYIYVWKNHEFAGREEISIEELADYPFLSFDQSDNSNYYLAEEALSDYDFPKSIKTDDRATSMEIMSALHGYSIGTGTLSSSKAILKGLVAIKLKEEDPLTIGYIVRKGGILSEYGEEYLKELLKYKEL